MLLKLLHHPKRLGLGVIAQIPHSFVSQHQDCKRNPKFPALSPPLPTGLLISRFVFTAVGTLPILCFTTPSFIPEMVGAHGCWGHGLSETHTISTLRKTAGLCRWTSA